MFHYKQLTNINQENQKMFSNYSLNFFNKRHNLSIPIISRDREAIILSFTLNYLMGNLCIIFIT